MTATKKGGAQDLVDMVDCVAKGETPVNPKPPRVREDHQEVLDEIGGLIAGCVPAPYPEDWVALKLLP